MKKQSGEYYTVREAQAKLGLSKAVFHRKVSTGLIPKVLLPGMKRGVYAKSDIDALSITIPSSTRTVFSRSTPADQVEEMAIGIRCFGQKFITSLPERIAFQQKSEHTFYSLKVYEDVVGYLSLFHLRDCMLTDLLTGRKSESEITLRDIKPFTRPEPFSVYIDVVAIDPSLPDHVQHLYAGIMIFCVIDLILDLLVNNYLITHLFTVTTRMKGDHLVRKIGFEFLEGKSLVTGRSAYVYPLDDQGIRYLQRFHKVFQKRLHISSYIR